MVVSWILVDSSSFVFDVNPHLSFLLELVKSFNSVLSHHLLQLGTLVSGVQFAINDKGRLASTDSVVLEAGGVMRNDFDILRLNRVNVRLVLVQIWV